MKKYWLIIILAASLFSIQAVHVNKERLYEIAKNIEIFTNVFKELNTNYVDNIDPSELMKTGIDAMVNSLDPYTRYISESQIESFRISTEGKYSGIGAVINEVDSVLTMIEAYKDSPAIKAGLIPGDQIISINGEQTKGRDRNEVRNIMRGAPGTAIDLEIKRYGVSALKNIVVNRTEINIPNVPHFEVLDSNIAYVHLSTFTKDAGKNIRSAIKEMQEENELKGIVLDLRFNGGGLLNEAIAVTNIFVNKDEELVATKGKVLERDRVYKTTMTPLDTSLALVVLINKRSASASEIVSGAIQDLDRGVLIGQKSYGKGLVQNTRKVGYNSQVKLTTSKYYIPSGRCIQSVEYENGEPVDIPIVERKAFKTRNGRKVLDGGGVLPDIKMPGKEVSEFVQFLLNEKVIFKFVNAFYADHDSIPKVEDFSFEDFDSFRNFYTQLNLNFKSKLQLEFEKFEEQWKKDNPEDSSPESFLLMKNEIEEDASLLLERYQQEINEQIGKEIVSRYYFLNGKIRYALRNDPELDKAIDLIRDQITYKSILSGPE